MEVLLCVFNLSHVELTYSVDVIMFVNYRRCLPLGL